MKLFEKEIEKLDEVDINRLIENEIPESKNLDYKAMIHKSTVGDKKELLADISSFNNTNGGLLIYGINEKRDENSKNTGVPESVSPIEGINEDQFKLSIEHLAKDGLSPPLTNLNFKFIKIVNGHIICIGIPRNFGIPRMVISGGSYKFYKRNNSGKYIMGVYELNNEFLSRNNIRLQFDRQHQSRLDNIKAGKFLNNIDKEHFFLLSAFPMNFERSIDIASHKSITDLKNIIKPLNSQGYEFRHNLEGFMSFASHSNYEDNTNSIHSYTQLFRTGEMEFYNSYLLWNNKDDNRRYLLGIATETAIDECIVYILMKLTPQFLQADPP